MKKLFVLFSILTICIFSCMKSVKEEEVLSNNPIGVQSGVPSITANKIASKYPISLLWYHKFIYFTRDCQPGTWYCWQIGSPNDNRSFLQIDTTNRVITFGIDNRDSSAYNQQFMYGMEYQFPQDTLNSNLTYAASGSKDLMYVKQGLYHFDIVDSTVVIKVPYSIVR